MRSKVTQYIGLHQSIFLYSTIFGLFAISVASRILFNGMIFDFDYHLYQPDGAVYTYMALKYAGFSHVSAAQQVIDWYAIYAEPGTSLSLSFFSPETNPGVWSLGGTRVFYPLLSTPFVYMFGIEGMLVIPILSFFLLLIVVMRISQYVENQFVGLGLIFLITTSPTISRWYVANITDGVLATIFAVALLVALKYPHQKALIPLSLLIAAGSATRFSAPFWIALAIIYWTRDRRTSLILFFVTIICVIPTLAARPDSGSIVAGAEGGVIAKILYFPVSALRILFIEFAQLAAVDRSLLVALLAAIITSLWHLKDQSSQLFLLMGMAGWFIGALNGVLGVNFRYQLPLIVFACWVILNHLKFFRNRSIRNVIQIV